VDFIKQLLNRLFSNDEMASEFNYALHGRTIIEEFEHHAAVGFAVVLLTPDDVGAPKADPTTLKPRPRQNVVFELGYFKALGHGRVRALVSRGVDMEIFSDYSGVPTIRLDSTGAWPLQLARELKAAGLPVDLNLAV
jgi:predicted nucleotide-binding protein